MLLNVTGQIDPAHLDIVLAESLVNLNDDFYDLTLEQALKEILDIDKEKLLDVNYEVNLAKSFDHTKITKFLGWTKTKVIFLNQGLFVSDTLLDYVPRNPP